MKHRSWILTWAINAQYLEKHMSSKPWTVYSKYGVRVTSFSSKLQAEHYAKNIGGYVHYTG